MGKDLNGWETPNLPLFRDSGNHRAPTGIVSEDVDKGGRGQARL